MSASIGNKYGKGYGRPRKYDREEMGDKIIEWSRQDDALNMNEFCDIHDIHADYLWDWCKQSEYFSECYKIAKAKIAARREKLINRDIGFNYGAYQRQLTVYDRVTHKYDREEKEWEEKLKQLRNDDEFKSQLDQLLDKFKPKE